MKPYVFIYTVGSEVYVIMGFGSTAHIVPQVGDFLWKAP